MRVIQYQNLQRLFFILVLSTTSFPVALTTTVRACPESTGVCLCNSLQKSVVCSRLSGIAQRIPVGIPENTLKLTLQYTNLRRIDVHAFRSNLLLQEININKNLLEEISTFAFHKLVYLRNLSLAENSLRFLNEKIFTNLHNLQHLNLSHNCLIALAPQNFADLRNLQSLDLRNNPTICVSPDAFAGLNRLKELQVSYLPAQINSKLLSPLTQIVRFSVSSVTGLTNFQEDFLKTNLNLRDLKIEYLMSLENKGLSDNFLVRQKQLETLTISACNLTSVPSSMLYKVKSSLLYLDLSKNPFTCIKKDDLSFLFRLRTLILKQTGIHTIESNALSLIHLHELDLSGNRLSGLNKLAFGETIPSSLRNLNLGNNPISCDCDLNWIAQKHFLQWSDTATVCVEPPAMQGLDIRYAVKKDGSQTFPCEVPRINFFGVQHSDTSKKIVYSIVNNSRVSFSIRCTASGFPKPDIHWVLRKNVTSKGITPRQESKVMNPHFCDKKALNHRTDFWKVHKNGLLVLNSIPIAEVMGIYTCVAENSEGMAQKSVLIKTGKNTSATEKGSITRKTKLVISNTSSLLVHPNRNSSASKLKSISKTMKYSVMTYLTTSKKMRPKIVANKNSTVNQKTNSTEDSHNADETHEPRISRSDSNDYYQLSWYSDNQNKLTKSYGNVRIPTPKSSRHDPSGAAKTFHPIKIHFLVITVLLYFVFILL